MAVLRPLVLTGLLVVTALLVMLTVTGATRERAHTPGDARPATTADGIQPPTTSDQAGTRPSEMTSPTSLAGLSTTDARTSRASDAGAPSARTSSPPATDLERQDRANLLAVVTKRTPVDPLDYAPDDLVTWPGTDYQVRQEVAEQLELLFAAAEADDLGFRVISGYRSYETQAGTYDYWLRQSGRAAADATSARPGHSEHQTGLAVDLDNLTGECYLEQCFGETDDGRWLAEHAHEFGFLISYPQGARAITGFAYEPWHVRYVGPQVAGDMERRGIALLSSYLGASASSARVGERLGSLG